MRPASTHAGYYLPHPARLALLAGAMLALTLAVTFEAAAQSPQQKAPVPDPQRRAELAHIVRHDCGSCHGLTLSGGLGPALLPQVLRQKPAPYLKAVILNGLHGTAMPGWAPLLTDAEAQWIAEQLLKGFPGAR
jgi:cytochrome c55X